MKVFLGWSQKGGKAVAQILAQWLELFSKRTIEPVGSFKIPTGTVWQEELEELLQADFGILCFTQDSEDAWLCYEAGILTETTRYVKRRLYQAQEKENPSTGRAETRYVDREYTVIDPEKKSRVAPVSFGRTDRRFPKPLSRYQSVQFGMDAMYELAVNLNDAAMSLDSDPTASLPVSELKERFYSSIENNYSYLKLESDIAKAMKEHFEAYLPVDFKRDLTDLSTEYGAKGQKGRLYALGAALADKLLDGKISPQEAKKEAQTFREDLDKTRLSPDCQDCRELLDRMCDRLGRLYFKAEFLLQ